MDAQLKRGMTDACVLALLLKEDSYGYRLSRQARDVMPLSESTLYPVLRRLQEADAVTAYTREHGGRLRRYYAITQKGRELIGTFLTEWEQLDQVYAFIRRMNEQGRHTGFSQADGLGDASQQTEKGESK